MREDFEKLAERMLDFGVAVIGVVEALPRTMTGRHVAGQLLRSATSAGSNYEETCAAESRADFIHKIQIVLRELRESRFWLRLIARARLLPESKWRAPLQEADEMCRIIGKSVTTAKSRG